MIHTRISCLQQLLQKKNITAIIIPTQDFHMSEYVGDYFKAREYFSGFTGSAGTMVITQTQAHLWTDGRYFIQAPKELEGSGVILQKSGEEGVPTVKEFIQSILSQGDVLAVDGRVLSENEGQEFYQECEKKGAQLYTQEDLINCVWENRPLLSAQPAFELDIKYAGKFVEDKLEDIRLEMKKRKADVHIMTALDDIAWTFNIRGSDVAHTPVVLAYAAITAQEAILFANSAVFDEKAKLHLQKSNVTLRHYEEIYSYVKQIPQQERVLLDKSTVNYSICQNIKAEVLDDKNPAMIMKSVKNPVEVANAKKGHIWDGVAVTKFMYWIKNNVGKIPLTEFTAQEYLAQLRSQQPGFLDLSFTTIAGYKENAAMMHYSADEKSAKPLAAEGMLLVDSGGQYLEGTTDITRTFVLGPITPQQKVHFTAVVQGVLAISNLKFLQGCTGINFDVIARQPLWQMDLDYKCGSGHGVGYLLGVHEGPNGFRWKNAPGKNEGAVFTAGMITTIEPGVYIEGSHGIRIENEILCCEGVKNEYGQFMYFEPITMAPIDLDGIDPQRLSSQEKAWLNAYHKVVYTTISPYLTPEETQWLQEYTKAI